VAGVSPALHDEVALRLARCQQRYTRARRELVDALATAGRPLTIPEVLGLNRGLTQSSAYRNITLLIQARAVRRVDGVDDHARFELAEDLSGHHHHVVCESCGKVADVHASPRLERALAEAARAVAEEGDFAVVDHRFDLFGVCADCR
jgi:Fe2+ or Zn2+ uptake regulation protein